MYVCMYVCSYSIMKFCKLIIYVCDKTYLFHNCLSRNPERGLETFAHTLDPVLVSMTQA